jgi:hypothetical protein
MEVAAELYRHKHAAASSRAKALSVRQSCIACGRTVAQLGIVNTKQQHQDTQLH